MPVSTLVNGSGTRPSGRWSNSMNTRFQISSQRGQVSEWSGMQSGPSENCAPRSKWISLHGPHGPVSAIRQKLWSSPCVDVAPARHPLGRQADLVAPDVPGDLVVRVGRGRQPLAGDAQVAGQEVPGPVDRLALEVVAEAPVAEHLEERVVARRPADLLEVVVLAGDAQAALVVDRPRVRARLGAGEDVLELDHAGVGEEQRLVAGRDEAGAGHDGVAALGEELDEPAADLGGGQRHDPRIRGLDGWRHRAQWYRTQRLRPRTSRSAAAQVGGRGRNDRSEPGPNSSGACP